MALSSDALLKVADGLDVLLISDNELSVQFGSRSYPSQLLRDTDSSGLLGSIASKLLGRESTLQELLSSLPADRHIEAQALINDLLQRGILTEIHKDPVEQYLSYSFTGNTKLAERSVSLVGAGPVGVRIAEGLLQHGVGKLTIVDDREAGDLWARFAPRPGVENTHRPAHAVLRDQLTAAGCKGVTSLELPLNADGVAAAVAASGFTVVALEQQDPRIAHEVNRFCLRSRKPWLIVVIDGNFGMVGPLFLPVDTACYNDLRVLADAAQSGDMARRYRRYVFQRGPGSFFVGLPVYADIMAGYACLAVIQFLLRGTCFALGRALTMDFDRMQIDIEDILKLPRCPVCSSDSPAYQPPFSAEVVTRSSSMTKYL